MAPETKQRNHLEGLLPAMIVIVAALVRLVYLAEIVHDPAFSHPLYDPEYNAHWARGIATGDWTPPVGVHDPEITTTPHGRPPGYPWFLAAIYILFGVNDYAPRLVQMCLGVINALLLYFIGKRLFGRSVGFVAGMFMATYWVFPYFEGVLTYPVLAVFIAQCLILVLIRWQDALQMRWAVLAGLMLGGFALLRPNVLLFMPVLALWMLWLMLRGRRTWQRCFLTLAALALGCAAVLSPAFIRNHIVADDFVFISSYGGINLYVGNHPEASLVEPRIPELMALAGIENWTCFDYPAIVRGVAAQQGKEEISFSEANSYFYHKAFAFIRERPDVFMKNIFRKALLFWGPYEITNDTVMHYDKQFSPTLRYLPGFPWFAALFVFGSLRALWKLPRLKRSKTTKTVALLVLLWLYVGAYCLSVILYFVAGRYRVPVMPVLLLFGAYGVVQLTADIKARRGRPAWVGLVVLAALCLLFHWNPTGYVPQQGTWHLRRAMAWTAADEEEKAEAEYQKALEHDASSSVAYANLGRLHIARGQRDEGIALYRQGLLLNPHSPIIHNNLGYELYQMGEVETAISHFEQAVAVNPRFALAHINLGNTLVDHNARDRALYHFREALRIAPGDAAAPYNIARVLFAKGNDVEAAAYYEKAIEVRPTFAEALNNLGYLYASRGDYDAAIPYYQRAIAAAPDFVLAYNNLGNALMETGDIAAAAELYEQALEHQERNTHALFNLARVNAARAKWVKAISNLEYLLEIQPDYVPALVLLGEAYLEMNAPEDALTVLEQAVALMPEAQEPRRLITEALKRMGENGTSLDADAGVPQEDGATDGPAGNG